MSSRIGPLQRGARQRRVVAHVGLRLCTIVHLDFGELRHGEVAWNPLALRRGFEGGKVESICTHGTRIGRDKMIIRNDQAPVVHADEQDARYYGRPIRVAAPFRRGWVDPVRRRRPHAAAWLALLRSALARGGGRVPLRRLGRGNRDRRRRPPHAPSRRRSLLASGGGERPPSGEPFEYALLLPHPRLPGNTRRRPLPRSGRRPVRLRRWVVAARARRRDPDQGRKGPLIGKASGQLISENAVKGSPTSENFPSTH